MRLVDLRRSSKKRYMAVFEKPSMTVHFGEGQAFVDHGNTAKRTQYLSRPRKLTLEDTFDREVLWGASMSVERNLAVLFEKMGVQDARF